MPKLPRVKPGDLITEGLWNALIDAANAANIVVGVGLEADGNVLSALVSKPIQARITGAVSGGQHPWIEVYPVVGGTWTDGSRTGTAYERNGSTTTLTNKIVDIYTMPVGTYTFDA